MPRHDRAYGATVPTKRSGGGNGRRTRTRGKNTYAPKKNRRPADGPPQEHPEAQAEAEAQTPEGRK